jgi:hypothetical protein
MVASRGACLNRTQVTKHRVFRAHFDNSERPAGMDLCIYCVVGFGFRFSPPIRGVDNPRGAVATWLGGKAFPRLGKGNLLRESRRRPTPHSPKAIRSIACGDEAKIYLRHQTLSDFCFRLRSLDRNCRRSTGRASDCFEGSELWMEFVSPSSDRWKNRRERGTRPPL